MKQRTKFICPYCKSVYKKFRSTQPNVCSSYECIKEFNSKKEIEKRVKEIKVGLKTLSQYEKVARSVFQTFIRLRDKDLPCISCGAVNAKMDAGHFFSAEAYSGIIFHEDNVNNQCHSCNRFLHGNFHEYKKGLIKKIGEQRVWELESIADFNRVRSYTREEYEEITKKYKDKIKQFKNK